MVYISIGNSDDELSQRRWSDFVQRTHTAITAHASVLHGSWVSPSAQPWQNACWCAAIPPGNVNRLKDQLRALAGHFDQDSIAWAEAPDTQFLSPADHTGTTAPTW